MLLPAHFTDTGGTALSHGSATSVLVAPTDAMDKFAYSKTTQLPRAAITALYRAQHRERRP